MELQMLIGIPSARTAPQFAQNPMLGAVLFGVEFRTICLQIFFDLFKVHTCHFQRYFVLDGSKGFDCVKLFFLCWFFSFSLHTLKFLLVNVFLMMGNLNEC